MRRVLLATGGRLSGRLAAALSPAAVDAMVLLYRVCVYWFLVLIGGASLAMTATSLATATAEAREDPDVAEHLESSRLRRPARGGRRA